MHECDFFYYDWKFMAIFFGAYIKTNYFCKIRQLYEITKYIPTVLNAVFWGEVRVLFGQVTLSA